MFVIFYLFILLDGDILKLQAVLNISRYIAFHLFCNKQKWKNFKSMCKCRYIYIIWCGMKSKLAQINFQRIKLLTSVIKLAAADTKGTMVKCIEQR